MKEIMAVDTDLELLFCTKVLKLRSLHYGYWEGDEKLDFENLRTAQHRYTETLISLIPQNVGAVLDVGCGIGDIAFTLAERGYTVTAISPDKHHRNFFIGSNSKNVDFYNSRFEDFESNQRFDLILMSESQNYFDTDVGFAQCTKHLKQGGYLLVSGMFRTNDANAFEEIRTTEDEYIQRAKSFGFILTNSVNITDNVLPTVKVANNAYRQYVLPSLNVIDLFLENSTSVRIKLAKLFFLNELKRSSIDIHRYYKKRLNPYLFRKHVKYLRLLFHL